MERLTAESDESEPLHLSFGDLHREARGGDVASLLQAGFHAHAVWEAAGVLLERVRDLTDPGHPGSIDRTRGLRAIAALFGTGRDRERPRIAFNRFESENEISEHRGLAEVMSGVVLALRNPFSHNYRPEMERGTALEWLATISALHRRLDSAVDFRSGSRALSDDAGIPD